MDSGVFDINNVEVQMTMVVKLHQLQREALPHLTYQNLEAYLTQVVWKKQLPRALHEAADDVLRINANDIVRFLSRQAITEGEKAHLEDFADLIGGF